ncbi:MAG: protein-glutamate O-methyltransferase CheR [Bacteroidales bacterium]|jgi:chemotaxis protein methyltransferase CheR|nr:protein-glutamate O-methyltransferase CheR [Bacteroidales bacterium]MDY0085596.1 protein-glutamate O-methyltransferase CheR [Bacteroidales bacterium]
MNTSENPDFDDSILQLEMELLLEALVRQYGYDFRNYNKAHIKRRLIFRMQQLGLKSLSELQHQILHHTNILATILKDLSINVTEMYRDPSFYLSLRKEVIPLLRTYPYLRIWHAGCATGEEVYSFAILLKEEGLYERSQIYATDFNTEVLETAKKGIYPVSKIKEYTFNYQAAGGKNSFSDYYTARYDAVRFDPELRKNIVFANHNLVTDSVFAETHLIICRNVLIYFDRSLQNKVLNLFNDSLIMGGFLGLGSKENIMFSTVQDHFLILNPNEKIFQKKILK